VPLVQVKIEVSSPPIADRAKAVRMSQSSTSSAQGYKHPHIVAKRSEHSRRTSEVITHIELPPYHGPHSPLDLVPYEIVFSHVFEAFHQMLRAKTDDQTTLAGDDHQPLKRTRRVPAPRKILVVK
jgi:hypothetical protein